MRSARAGSALALVLDLLVLSDGHLSLWRPMGLLGSFFDAQGRALLHGHLAVPASSVSFEGFLVGGHTYMYFGPVPALLRMPVLLVTHALDGRLSQLSMLVALIVLLSAGARVHWRVRELVRPGAPLAHGERLAIFVLALTLGAGGVPLFLVSWPVVYHEAELWGAALAIAAVSAVLGVAQRPTARRIAWAGGLSILAVNTRVSVGLGPIVALALLAGGLAVRAASDRLELRPRAHRLVDWVAALGPAEPTSRARTVAALTLCAAVAIATELAVNQAKFHTPLGLPMYDHVNFHIDPAERAAVEANHGSVVGTQFLPTTLLAAVRPDAVGLVRAFPFFGLPQSAPTVIGSARFVGLLPSLSVVTSMPLFCLLLLVGLPAIVRNHRTRPLIGVLFATAAAFTVTLLVSSVATRYLGDLLPFLWVGACAGLQALIGSSRASSRLRWPRAVHLGLGAMVVCALVGIVINGSVGLVQQRLLAPTTSPSERASFVEAQEDVDHLLHRRPRGVHAGTLLPSRSLGPAADLFVLGRCAGLYVEGFGGSWLPVERSSRSGLHELEVRWPPAGAARTPQALLTLGVGARRVTTVVAVDSRGVVFSVRVNGRNLSTSAPVTVDPGRLTRVTARIDPLSGNWYLSLQVQNNGTVLSAPVPYDRLASESLGSDPSDPHLARFKGSVSKLPEPTPVCHQVAADSGLL